MSISALARKRQALGQRAFDRIERGYAFDKGTVNRLQSLGYDTDKLLRDRSPDTARRSEQATSDLRKQQGLLSQRAEDLGAAARKAIELPLGQRRSRVRTRPYGPGMPR